MKRITSPILALFLAVIILGGGFFLNSLTDKKIPKEIYDREKNLKAVSNQTPQKTTQSSWMDDLDKVIPPEERRWISDSDSSDVNISEKMVRELMTKIMESGVDLGDIDEEHPDFYENFSRDFIKEESKLIILSEDLFKMEDIKIKENATKKDIKKYGNEVGAVIVRNFLDAEKVKDLYEEFIKYKSRESRTKLITLGSNYDNTAEEIMNITVPKEIADVHLDFANYLKKASVYIKNIASISEDPIIALTSIERYFEENQEVLPLLEKVTEYFQNEKVSFEKHETGAAYIITYN